MNNTGIDGDAKKAKRFAEEAFRTGDVVFALDLDFTLAHYRNGLRGLYALLHDKYGIPEGVAHRACIGAEACGFSFEVFYHILALQTHLYVNEHEFVKYATAWFKENYVLYEDAHAFLAEYLDRVPIVIVTAGDEKFQQAKIDHLAFVPDEVIVIPVHELKKKALKKVYERYQKIVVFVDDNPSELDSIAFDAWFCFPTTSFSVLMVREDHPHRESSWSKKFQKIDSFDKLRKLIPFGKEVS